MYTNILVPVSFEAGRDASQALEVARQILEPPGRITILHVLEHYPQYASDLLPEGHFKTARTQITEKLASLADSVPDTEIVVVEGHGARTILEFAQNHGSDCIVIASHRPGMQDLVLGSTAARVVRHAKCSVHVVR